jgi:hypothetical protein
VTRFLHMLSKGSNFPNKLLCRTGLPTAVEFCRGSINIGVRGLCSPDVFSIADDIATGFQSLSSSPNNNVSEFCISIVPVEDHLRQLGGSVEKSLGKSIANGSAMSLCSFQRIRLAALSYKLHIRMINISMGCHILPWTPSSRVLSNGLPGVLVH